MSNRPTDAVKRLVLNMKPYVMYDRKDWHGMRHTVELALRQGWIAQTPDGCTLTRAALKWRKSYKPYSRGRYTNDTDSKHRNDKHCYESNTEKC